MIRTAKTIDLVEVSKLWVAMVLEARPDWRPRPDWWVEIAARSLASGTYTILIDVDRAVTRGFIDFFLFPEPSTGKVHAVGQHFYVPPRYRRTRVAWELYNTALGMVNGRAQTIDLFCFDSETKFWEKRGYRHTRSLMRLEVDHV